MKIALNDHIPQLKDPQCVSVEDLKLSQWTWAQALLQSGWGVHVLPDQQTLFSIMRVAFALTRIQDLYPGNKLMPVSWYRCELYNQQIKGAAKSAHVEGLACDFIIKGLQSQKVRDGLKDKLLVLEIRMEQLASSDNWIHIDLRPPGPSGRYFKP